METIFALVITVLVLGFVGLPLLRGKKHEKIIPIDEETLGVDILMSRKDTAITAIRELEFDHAVGNLSDEDYEELKERYERRAISILKSLDEVQGEDGIRDKKEQCRKPLQPNAVSGQVGQKGEDQSCPGCGKKHGPEHRFCTSCGTVLGNFEKQAGTKNKSIAVEKVPAVAGQTMVSGRKSIADRGTRSRHADGPGRSKKFGREVG